MCMLLHHTSARDPLSNMSAGGPGSGRHKGLPSVDSIQKKERRLEERRIKEAAERKVKHDAGLSVRGKPLVSEKAQLALKSMNVATKAIHDKAEECENAVHKALGTSKKSGDNSPFDITMKIGNRNIGIEVKSIQTQKNDKITQKGDAIERKMNYAKANNVKGMYTVVADYRNNQKNPDMYVRKGIGSFRIGNMTKVVGGMKALKNYIR